MNWNKKSNCSTTKRRSLFAFYEFWHVLWMGENSSKINVSNGIALIYWISSLSFKMNCTAFKVSQNYWRYSAQCSKANQPLWRRQQRRSLNHQTPHRMMIANDGFEESEKAINQNKWEEKRREKRVSELMDRSIAFRCKLICKGASLLKVQSNACALRM